MKYDEETKAEALERTELEAGYLYLFKDDIAASIQMDLPLPWTQEYRDLLRACIAAKSRDPIAQYIEAELAKRPGATIH